jgi:GxxExxY protein
MLKWLNFVKNDRMYNNENYPYQTETGQILKIAYEVHQNLGAGFLEVVYKDAFEHEFDQQRIEYEREKEYIINYKGYELPHRFYADFIVFDSVILEVKAKQKGIAEEDLAQTINYLKVSGCKVGLILNFARLKLDVKRVVF